jgi:Asp-tRNA(Asn)/Glu-tRNA(Gln) amidotransferase A subunit family amidase
MVAARCVPIALGSDIGGSIRIPATFNGITGFKPTPQRISAKGMNDSRLCEFNFNSGHFKPAAGPLAHTVEDCISLFKLQCRKDAHLGDPFIPPVPFN